MYVICDTGLPVRCDWATVNVTVLPENHRPQPVDDYGVTVQDVSIVLPILANDTDPEDGPPSIGQWVIVPSSVTLLSQPANGSATVNHVTGDVTYTPGPGFTGRVEWDYRVCDGGGLCGVAKVVVDVLPIGPLPPVAHDEVIGMLVGEVGVGPIVIAVLANDTDGNGDIVPTSVTVTRAPDGLIGVISGGPDPVTGALNFTLVDAGFRGGPVSFEYEVCDATPVSLGGPLCDRANVTIYVGDVNVAPIAIDDTQVVGYEASPGVDIDVVSNDTDVNENLDVSSVQVIRSPSHGTIVQVNAGTGEVTYKPDAGFHGLDEFDYLICDTGRPALCDVATVRIVVTPPAGAGPNGPVAVDDYDTVWLPPVGSGQVETNVTVNDSDVDGDLQVDSVVITAEARNGSVQVLPNPSVGGGIPAGPGNGIGVIRYIPDAGFVGVDQYDYKVL